jgi:hypothetical protein
VLAKMCPGLNKIQAIMFDVFNLVWGKFDGWHVQGCSCVVRKEKEEVN